VPAAAAAAALWHAQRRRGGGGGGRKLDLHVAVYMFAGGCMHCNGMCNDHDTLQGNQMMPNSEPEVKS
jgi:hypothetical protein